MPKEKFTSIYETLKDNIVKKKYQETNMLPSELSLVEEFHCSRNTIRRAIAQLNSEGYVQSIKGKGVIVLEMNDSAPFNLSISNFSGLNIITKNKDISATTSVLSFEKTIIDETLHTKTGFKIGSEVYHLHRLRYINNEPLILDINYFLCDVVKDLTVEIAQKSIYHYIQHDLGLKIPSSRRMIRVEKATSEDLDVLALKDYNCVGVIISNTFIEDGRMFEYTESRHTPDNFTFVEFAQNQK